MSNAMSSEKIAAITEGIRLLTFMPPKGFNVTGRGFFSLPSELRNIIYEYVLADVEDSMVVDLSRGLNKKSRVDSKDRTAMPSSDREASPLNILLTCKQINSETTAMAYGRMSIIFDEVITEKISFVDDPDHCAAVVNAFYQCIKDVLEGFAQIFRAPTLTYLTRMEFRNSRVISHLALAAYDIDSFHWQKRKTCNHMCDLRAAYRGLAHKTFHNVRRVVVYTRGYSDDLCDRLKAGASWLSVIMGPQGAVMMLRTFSNLEQIVVRREDGRQQSSYVIWRMIYSGPSGMPLGGFKDQIPDSQDS